MRIFWVLLFTLPWWLTILVVMTGPSLTDAVRTVGPMWLVISPGVYAIFAAGAYKFGFDDGRANWFKDAVRRAGG